MATDDGATVAGQPEVAASWFPANDHPQDKAAYTFVVAVPDGQEVVANGVLQSRRSHQGWTTFTWRAAEPMAPYLATIDIGRWDVRTWKTDSGLPVYDAVDPDLVADPVLGPAIDASLKRQGEIVDVLADHFGPYPFHTVGAIVDDQDDLYFALETQTRPVYSRYFWPDGGDFVVAHELAHQWFGDDVALARWQDIWLNEGFATYAEWLWAEHEGLATPAEMARVRLRPDPRRRPVLGVADRRPGCRAPVRRAGVRPRRDGAAGAARRGGRAGLLADHPDVGRTAAAGAPAPRHSSSRWPNGSPAPIWRRSSTPGSTPVRSRRPRRP